MRAEDTYNHPSVITTWLTDMIERSPAPKKLKTAILNVGIREIRAGGRRGNVSEKLVEFLTNKGYDRYKIHNMLDDLHL